MDEQNMQDLSTQSMREKGDRMARDYEILGGILDRQKRLIKLLIALLSALSVTLLFLGLSSDCLQEIFILLAGITLTVAFYSAQTQTDSGGAPKSPPDWP